MLPIQHSLNRFRRLIFSISLIVAWQSAHSQILEKDAIKTPITFKTSLVTMSGGGSLTMGFVSGDSIISYSTSSSNFTFNSDPIDVNPKPGKYYNISVSAGGLSSLSIVFEAPPGYVIYLNNVRRNRLSWTNWWEMPSGITFRVEAESPAAFGAATSLRPDRIAWSVGLGNLVGGKSAGSISLRRAELDADAYKASALDYDTSSPQVERIFDGNGPRQYYAPAGLVDVITDDDHTFRLKFYSRGSGQIGSKDQDGLYILTGDPLYEYIVENPAYPDVKKKLRITKIVRQGGATRETWTELENISTSTPPSENGPFSVMEWSVKPSGATSPASPTQKITHTNGVTYFGDGTTSAFASNYQALAQKEQSRTYTSYTWGGELTAFGAGSSTGAFSYANKRVTVSNVAGQPQVANVYNGDGLVNRQHKSFMNSGYDVNNVNQADVTIFTYTADWTGRAVLPQAVTNTINGALTGKKELTYSYDDYNSSGMMLVVATQKDYYTSTNYHSTITKTFREDADPLYRLHNGMPHSVQKPDGTMSVTLYFRGAFYGRAFTEFANGPEMLAVTFNGTSISSSESALFSSYAFNAPLSGNGQGSTLPTESNFYVVPGRSTAEAVVQGADGAVLAKISLFCTGTTSSPQWEVAQRDVFHYSSDGYHIGTSRDRSSMSDVHDILVNSWSRGLIDYSIDDTGIRTDFTYDSMNRVLTKVRQGASGLGTSIATTTTTFSYDVLSNPISEIITSTGSAETLTTLRTFDAAGHVTSETKPGYNTAGSSTASASTTTYGYWGDKVLGTTLPCSCTVNEDYYYDGRKKSKTGTATVAEYYSYSVESNGGIKTRIHIGTNGGARYHDAWADMIGRVTKKSAPGFTGQAASEEVFFYEDNTGANTGRLVRSTKTGLADTLYLYNSMSQLVRTGLDLDSTASLILSSIDRITDTDERFEQVSGAWYKTKTSTTYPFTGSSTAKQMSKTMQRVTFQNPSLRSAAISYDAEGNGSSVTIGVDATNKLVTTETTRPGMASSYEKALNGFVVENIGHDGLTFKKRYDALLRLTKEIDPRTGSESLPSILTVYHTNTAWVKETRDPLNKRLSLTHYDPAHRVVYTEDALGRTTRTAYGALGKVSKIWGTATYPVEYSYNEYGDRTKMRTFRDANNVALTDTTTFPSLSTYDETTWEYDAPTALLKKKIDAKGKVIEYGYNVRKQLAWKLSPRGYHTNYLYYGDNFGGGSSEPKTGELRWVIYADGTPTVQYSYTRSGQTDSVADATGTHDFVYDSSKPWQLSAEALDTFYGSRVITRNYEVALSVNTGDTSYTGHTIGSVPGRANGFKVGTTSTPAADLEYIYSISNAGRFAGLESKRGNGSASRKFAYGYETNSSLVKSMSVVSNPFFITRDFETNRDLVTNVEAKWSSTTRTKYAYVYNDLRQRESVVQSGDVFADYGGPDNGAIHQIFTYNGRGELTGAGTYLNATATDQSSPLSGRRHEYDYDGIGNRKWSNTSGNSGLRDNYTVNELNQYVTKENNTLSVGGTADSDALVAVRASGLTGRAGRHWGDNITLENFWGPFYGPLRVYAVKPGTGGAPYSKQTIDKMAFLPKAAQSFSYDLEGNLTNDGVWTYQWDAENRLTAMQTTPEAIFGGVPAQRVEFKYDYLHRRVEKLARGGWNGTTFTTVTSQHRYLYDGWSLIAEFSVNGGTLTLARSYTWGLDVACSLLDAGGVGALLQIRDYSIGKDYFPSYDGNGNIAGLFDADAGNIVAAYEYSPYGEVLRCEGMYAKENPFRFSTKFTDDETGLVYYGQRYYSPSQGRFLGRDPIEEEGGLNLYAFCINDSINNFDVLGNVIWAAGMTQAEFLSQVAKMFGYSADQANEFRIEIVQTGATTSIEILVLPEGGRMEFAYGNWDAGDRDVRFRQGNTIYTSVHDLTNVYGYVTNTGKTNLSQANRLNILPGYSLDEFLSYKVYIGNNGVADGPPTVSLQQILGFFDYSNSFQRNYSLTQADIQAIVARNDIGLQNATADFFSYLAAARVVGVIGGTPVLPGAGVIAGSSSNFAQLTIKELTSMLRGAPRDALNKLFGDGLTGAQRALRTLQAGGQLPAGVTRQSLEVYREIALRHIARGADTNGAQAMRLLVIEEALRHL